MKQTTKRILAWMLAVCMTAGMLPDISPRVYADENEESFVEMDPEEEAVNPFPEYENTEESFSVSPKAEQIMEESTEGYPWDNMTDEEFYEWVMGEENLSFLLAIIGNEDNGDYEAFSNRVELIENDELYWKISECIYKQIHLTFSNKITLYGSTAGNGTYEYALFPMDNMNISQGVNGSYSHQGLNALDICGKDKGIENAYAPFTGTIKRIYQGYVVWLESNNPVIYADGTIDYMTIMFMHDNDTSDLYEGKVISQGEAFFQEGTAGNATGNHIHIECGQGKYSGTGWFQNSNRHWQINNSILPYNALYISESTNVINDYGYSWKKVNSSPGNTTSYNPEYAFDSCTPGYYQFSVSGWAFDRDNVDAPLQIRAYIDGNLIGTVTADAERTDVGNVYGVGSRHGFYATFDCRDYPGTHDVTLWATNIGGGSDVCLGTKTITIQSDPEYVFDYCIPGYYQFTVRGWAFDRDNIDTPLQIRVYIDGTLIGTVTADTERTDVGNVYGVGDRHGFHATFDCRDYPGTHDVTLWTSNIGDGPDVCLGTKTVTIQQDPEYNYDFCIPGFYQFTVRGWAFDRDNVDTPLQIRVYIDGTLIGTVTADTERIDVGNVYGVGDRHGFHATFDCRDYPGTHEVTLWTSNIGDGPDVCLGTKTVTIQSDTEAPVITDIKVSDISASGYTVTCTVTDNCGVDRVQFPTWTSSNGQDDIFANWSTNTAVSGVKNGNTYTYRVNVSDHNNERGKYNTHIYAYDIYGNRSPGYEAPQTIVPTPVDSIRITPEKLELTGIGSKETLTAEIYPSNATTKTVEWSTSNPSIAVVDNGEITAMGVGEAVITATASNGMSASCIVTVKEAIMPNTLTGIEISRLPSKLTYLPNEELDTTGLQIKLVYEDDSFEMVSEGFTAEGFLPGGEAVQKVTVRYENFTAEFEVYITDVLASGECGDNLTWTLDKDGVLTISGTGAMKDYQELQSPIIETDWYTDAPWWEYSAQISSVVLEKGVTTIGRNAFFECNNLTSVNIPSTLTSIEPYAFCGCIGLTGVTIPEGVTNIGECAFLGCMDMTSVTISESVTTIGEGAFAGCRSLNSVTIPKGVTRIGEGVFSGCSGLTSVSIPEGVTTIEANTFIDCTALNDVIIPSTVTTIGPCVFQGCISLTSVTIPEGVTSIGNSAFLGCSSLTSVNMPKGVASIGDGAFSYSGLKEIYFDGEAPTFYSDALYGITATAYYYASKAGWDNAIQRTYGGNITWVALNDLSITAQPQNQEGVVGETVTFTVQAAGEGLTYQWQFRKPNAATWNNSSAADSKTASIRVGVQANRDGQSYRCIVKDKNGNTVTSDPATMIVVVKNPLTIVAQPQNQEGAVGENVTFTVQAAGEGLTYQWQFRKPNAATWNNSSAADSKTASIRVGVQANRDGQSYRCTVKDKDGNSITSEPATLIVVVKNPLTIVAQPQNQEGAVGENVTFTVQATGEGLTYQWQFRKPNATTWNNSSAADSKTASIRVGVQANRDGQSYRCIVKDKNGNTVSSDPATLIVVVKNPLTIVAQPQNQEGAVGETVTFTVQATGEGLTYQWQFRKPNATGWNNSSAADSKTASIRVGVQANRDGQSYRCIVKDKDGNTITTEAAALTVVVRNPLTIVAQPQNQEGAVGENVTFTVQATGEGLTYQWQFRKPNATGWNNSSAADSKTASISVAVTAARNGQSYRCVVKDKDGNTVTTEAATLTVVK